MPNGPASAADCKKCDAKRWFANSDARWDVRSIPPARRARIIASRREGIEQRALSMRGFHIIDNIDRR